MILSRWLTSEFKRTDAMMRQLPWWLSSLFILAVVAMNLLAGKCILNRPWLALDAGFLVSWIVFLCMDVVVKLHGMSVANRLSVVAITCNVAAAIMFWIGAITPGTWSEAMANETNIQAINNAIDNTFSGTWYILFGSMTAFFVSAVINNYINVIIGKYLKRNTFFVFACRSYVSTAIAQVVDNALFAFIVSHVLFGWTAQQCILCAICAAAFELTAEIIVSPLGFSFCKSAESQLKNVSVQNLCMNPAEQGELSITAGRAAARPAVRSPYEQSLRKHGE